jgi:hypothetical protein
MRNISFAMTTPQFVAKTKTVTRRMGWAALKIGEVLCGVEKAQGLGKGEKIKRLGLIVVKDVRRERLRRMTDELDYGFRETVLEGFPEGHPNHFPSEFVTFFCAGHGCTPDDTITRIEFEYTPPPDQGEGR